MPNKPTDLTERTFLFSCDVVMFCREMAKEVGVNRQVSWQLLRSGTSVGANAEEAIGAFTRRDFASRNSIVLREARESRFWLRLIAATGCAAKKSYLPLLQEATELVAIFTVAVRNARRPIVGRGTRAANKSQLANRTQQTRGS